MDWRFWKRKEKAGQPSSHSPTPSPSPDDFYGPREVSGIFIEIYDDSTFRVHMFVEPTENPGEASRIGHDLARVVHMVDSGRLRHHLVNAVEAMTALPGRGAAQIAHKRLKELGRDGLVVPPQDAFRAFPGGPHD